MGIPLNGYKGWQVAPLFSQRASIKAQIRRLWSLSPKSPSLPKQEGTFFDSNREFKYF